MSDRSKYDSTAYVPDSYYLQQPFSLVFTRDAVTRVQAELGIWHYRFDRDIYKALLLFVFWRNRINNRKTDVHNKVTR